MHVPLHNSKNFYFWRLLARNISSQSLGETHRINLSLKVRILSRLKNSRNSEDKMLLCLLLVQVVEGVVVHQVVAVLVLRLGE